MQYRAEYFEKNTKLKEKGVKYCQVCQYSLCNDERELDLQNRVVLNSLRAKRFVLGGL
jgi:hypothetical protein